MTAAGATPDSFAAIEDLHAKKTGALFAAACELGAVAAGASPSVRARLGRYGMAFGIAFQHADDRDDGEFPELAAEAAARMKVLTADAIAMARHLPHGEVLAAVASWMGQKA
jgi:hypothetical protein